MINQPDTQKVVLPEFQRDILDKEGITALVEQVTYNRSTLVSRSVEFGIDPDFLQQNSEFSAGPFVSPAPFSTTFAGSVENVQTAQRIGKEITNGLQQKGFSARQYSVVLIPMAEIPRQGQAVEGLVIPKNKETNEKLTFSGKPDVGTIYGATTIEPEKILPLTQIIRDAYYRFIDRNPALRQLPKAIGKKLPDAINQDLQQAVTQAQNRSGDIQPVVRYVDFTNALNAQQLIRILPEENFTALYVDTQIYSPFLEKGIVDIARFVRKLDTVGFFQNNPGFVKIVNQQGKSEVLKVAEITDSDVMLASAQDERRISFNQLQDSGISIAPCKELSYLLCFGNIVPVIYGSQNAGEYYQPYAVARQQLQRLGLYPTMYRIQPSVPEGTNNIKTVFDFYSDLVLSKDL